MYLIRARLLFRLKLHQVMRAIQPILVRKRRRWHRFHALEILVDFFTQIRELLSLLLFADFPPLIGNVVGTLQKLGDLDRQLRRVNRLRSAVHAQVLGAEFLERLTLAIQRQRVPCPAHRYHRWTATRTNPAIWLIRRQRRAVWKQVRLLWGGSRIVHWNRGRVGWDGVAQVQSSVDRTRCGEHDARAEDSTNWIHVDIKREIVWFQWHCEITRWPVCEIKVSAL